MRQDTPIKCHAEFLRSFRSFFMVLRTITSCSVTPMPWCKGLTMRVASLSRLSARPTTNKTRFRNARRGFQGNLGQNIQRIS